VDVLEGTDTPRRDIGPKFLRKVSLDGSIDSFGLIFSCGGRDKEFHGFFPGSNGCASITAFLLSTLRSFQLLLSVVFSVPEPFQAFVVTALLSTTPFTTLAVTLEGAQVCGPCCFKICRRFFNSFGHDIFSACSIWTRQNVGLLNAAARSWRASGAARPFPRRPGTVFGPLNDTAASNAARVLLCFA
jgi:hypothetical protein